MSNALDIALAAPRNATNLVGCLSALDNQLRRIGDEAQSVRLIIAHAGPVPAALAQPFPHTHWLECQTQSALPDLWGRAIAETRGEMVAILDADCAIGEGWLGHALNLAQQPHDLIGGAVEPRGLQSLVAWAAFFVDYGAFLPPLPIDTPRELAGNNLLIRRALLVNPNVREFVAPQFWKAHWLNALYHQGIVGASAPRLVIMYTKNYTAREWLTKRFRHARCYGAMRVEHAPLRLRAAIMLLAPIVPAILFARVLRNVLPRRRYRRELLLSTPWIIGGVTAWAAGEWVGCVLGAGNSCREII